MSKDNAKLLGPFRGRNKIHSSNEIYQFYQGVLFLFKILYKRKMYPLPKQFQLSSLPQFYFCVDICNYALKKTSMKKNVFFRALPESPKPPPLTPIWATWSFFSDVKIQDLKVTWGRGGSYIKT